MKNTAALFGFTVLIAVLGFKISEEPGYNQVAETFKTHPSPLRLFNPANMAEAFSQTKPAEPKVKDAIADSLIQFAGNLLGTRYVFGGNEPGGFDCSGFTNYVYGSFGFYVPHGSVNQALSGKQIPLEHVRRGDLLIFTGTNPEIREPGHAGIVITRQGEPVKFIHASSNGGVKISEVTGTRYTERLLQVRRIL